MESRPRLLFLTNAAPRPPMDGAKLRDQYVLQLLREHYDVEVLDLEAVAPDRESFLKRALGSFRPFIVRAYNHHIETALKERRARHSRLWVSRLHMAKYIPFAKKLGYTIVLDEHNVESKLWSEMVYRHPLLWYQVPQVVQCAWHERRFCSLADVLIATSDDDARFLRIFTSNKPVHVIPNPIDCDAYATARKAAGKTFLFTGTLSYFPNREGIEWFVDGVLPQLRQSLGAEVPEIVVAGANPHDELARAVEGAGVTLVRNPPSMLPYLEAADIVFVPLLSGSGTRLKILEAIASGKPVVSTTKGAEGLKLIPGKEIVIADDPKDFAEALARLRRNPDLGRDMAERAFKKVEALYDWKSLRPTVGAIVREVQ